MNIYNFSFVAVFIAVMLPAAPTCVDAAESTALGIFLLPQVNEPFLNAPSGRQGYSGFIVRYSDEIKFTLL